MGAAVATACVALAGCSSSVEVATAPLSGSAACQSVAWPTQLGGTGRVATAPSDASVAAWGDPAVIARCGVPAPAPTTDSCIRVNGVDWVVRSLSDGTAAVTYGREPAIEVLAPAARGAVPLVLPAMTDAAHALPSTGHACS